jgi:25S rRNA (uracil2634-N3)-methyltransferase
MPLLSAPSPYDGDAGPGQILVTVFEGEPYTLWNVKDLARHVGLKPITQFAFQADAYPGYKHARTLGNIEGEHGGAWKGEDRKARTFVFEAPLAPHQSRGGHTAQARKRKRQDESSDDED